MLNAVKICAAIHRSNSTTTRIEPSDGVVIYIDPPDMFDSFVTPSNSNPINRTKLNWWALQAEINVRENNKNLRFFARVKRGSWKEQDVELAVAENRKMISSPEGVYNAVAGKIKSLTCGECGQSCTRGATLKRHIKTHQSDGRGNKRKAGEIECKECDNTFSRKDGLTRHMKKHTGVKSFQCSICDSSFFRKDTLAEHMRVHSGERPFACDECEMAFKQSSSLLGHKRLHSGERPFKCTKCELTFVQYGTMKGHEATHLNEQRFSCAICDSKFTRNSSLKKHMRIHTGERPFKCDQCELRFVQKGSLVEHQERHEESSRWKNVCEFSAYSLENFIPGGGNLACAKRFPNPGRLKQHIANVHTKKGQTQYSRGSEDALASFLTRAGIPFDRDRVNRISFTACSGPIDNQNGPSAARPDFHLVSMSERVGFPIIVIVCNDEFQHRMYPCDLRRVWSIFYALKQVETFKMAPVVFIRFNPHPYTKNGVRFTPSLGDRHTRLLGLLNTFQNFKFDEKTPNMFYMFYNMKSNDDGGMLPCLFDEACGENKQNADNLKDHVLQTIG
jgi:hypothetical protein